MDNKNITLAQHLDNLKIDSDLKSIINIISKTCYEISEVVRVSKINSLVGKTGKINVQGEQVEKLDQFSNDLLMKNLSDSVLGRLGMLVFVYFMAVYHGVNAGFRVRVKDLVLVITVYIIADHVR